MSDGRGPGMLLLAATLGGLVVATGVLAVRSCQLPGEIVVPTDAPTIQDAIVRVGPGGTVRILEGDYQERLVIALKHVALRGDGWVRLSSPDPEQPVITLGPGADVDVQGLVLRGGSAGIASEVDSGVPPNLDASWMRIQECGAGIVGHFGNLLLRSSWIEQPTGPGLELVDTPHTEVSAVIIWQPGGPGVSLNAGTAAPCTVDLSEVQVSDAQEVGMAIAGEACEVSIHGGLVHDAVKIGVQLDDVASADIDHIHITGVMPGEGGIDGDAIQVWASEARVHNCDLRDNAGAGVTVQACAPHYPSSLALGASRLHCNAFDIRLEPAREGMECDASAEIPLEDLGGNDCSCGEGDDIACSAAGPGGLIPAPPPPVPEIP